MTSSVFRIERIPNELVPDMIITGGYISVYRNEPPAVPVIGEWSKRCCNLQDSFGPVLDDAYNFEVRESDVWIVTIPKCGTTWCQEMTWIILNNFDFKGAKERDLTDRSPFLEFNGLVPNVPFNAIKHANEQKSPRVMKTHLPVSLIPEQLWTKKPKVIYVFRNPKDAAVSHFHHWRGMFGFKGSKESYMRHFMNDYVNYNPFWKHVLEFWNLRHEPHVYFTSYERMKSDLPGVVTDVCRFLGKTITPDQIDKLVDHLSFENMKVNPMCNHVSEFKSIREAAGLDCPEFRFVRRGIVGSHKDELPQEVIEEFDKWTADNLAEHNMTIEDIISYRKYDS